MSDDEIKNTYNEIASYLDINIENIKTISLKQ